MPFHAYGNSRHHAQQLRCPSAKFWSMPTTSTASFSTLFFPPHTFCNTISVCFFRFMFCIQTELKLAGYDGDPLAVTALVHGKTDDANKIRILADLCSSDGALRVVGCTPCAGVGIDPVHVDAVLFPEGEVRSLPCPPSPITSSLCLRVHIIYVLHFCLKRHCTRSQGLLCHYVIKRLFFFLV